MPASGYTRWFNSPQRIAAGGLLIVLVFAAVIGGYLATQPRGYDFSQNQKISPSSPLRLAFATEMDESSVEQYLTLPPNLEVTKEWKDNVLSLQPLQKLEMDATYVIRVDGRAMTKEGVPLGTDLEFTFIVTGAPIIAAQIPAPSSVNVPPDADITLVFDRPMVALTQVQGSAADKRLSGWPVTITPSEKGRWRWLGTTTASFVPSTPLALATKYIVNVPAGIKTISGEETQKDFTWTFETERPAALASEPKEGSGIAGPGSEISVTFTQDMDLISAKDSLVLTEKAASPTKRTAPWSSRW